MVIPITPSFAIDDRDFTERFVRASGPGGQNVNKVATAVELRIDLARVEWPEEIKQRFRLLAGSRVTSGDEVVIDAREHRTQSKNREAARARLVALLQQASRRPPKRRPSRPTASSKLQRLDTKRAISARKRARRKDVADD
jgi:ribosome-associated protein